MHTVLISPYRTSRRWWSALVLAELLVVTSLAALINDPAPRAQALTAFVTAVLTLHVWGRVSLHESPHCRFLTRLC